MDRAVLVEAFNALAERWPLFPHTEHDLDVWANSFDQTDPDRFRRAVETWMERHGQWPTVVEIHELVRRQSLGLANARAALAKGYTEEVRRLGRDPRVSWTEREDSPGVTHPAS